MLTNQIKKINKCSKCDRRQPVTQVNSKFINIKNLKTHFLQFGSSKKKLIFLHGWGVSAESFLDIAKKLKTEKNIEIILIDLPGFGLSDSPPPTGWNIHDYENWLEIFLEKLNIKKANFFGHSFGCRILVQFLLKNKNIAQKVILAGAAGIKWPLSLRQKISIIISKNLYFIKNFIPKKIQKFIMCKIFGARDWGLVTKNLKPTLKKVLEEPDFQEKLPNIKNEILLIWGANDQITPLKSGKVFAKKLSNAELKIIPEGRHGIHKTHADEITNMIKNFLKK